jgi:ParB family chromosome partitioning protein
MDANGWPALRLAQALHMSESTIIKALALLTLPAAVQDRVEAGELAPSVAYEVSKLDDPDAQAEVAARVVAEGLSRSETVEAVRKASRPAGKGRAAIRSRPRRPTVRTIKTSSCRLTLEFKRAVDLAEVIAALREATAKLEAEQGGDQAAA